MLDASQTLEAAIHHDRHAGTQRFTFFHAVEREKAQDEQETHSISKSQVFRSQKVISVTASGHFISIPFLIHFTLHTFS